MKQPFEVSESNINSQTGKNTIIQSITKLVALNKAQNFIT